MALDCCGIASKPLHRRVVTANVAIKGTEVQEKRVKIMFENRGPGTAFLSPFDDVAQNRGIRLLNGDVFIDEPPAVHCGEWWVIADAANTDIIITEWTQ